MSALARTCRLFSQPDCFIVEDDFIHTLNTTNDYVATLTDSGTATVVDAAKGILPIVASDGTVADNDEAYVQTKIEGWLFADNKPICCGAYVQFTEANTDDANIAFGMANAPVANTIVDDGAGIRTTGSSIAIYKVDGGTVWKCETTVNSVQTVSTSTTSAGGSSYQLLEIEVVDHNSTQIEVSFKVDGKYLVDSTSGLRIVHRVAFASATEMAMFAGVKNGGANLETLNVDYWYAVTRR